jgi:hypothetical protein
MHRGGLGGGTGGDGLMEEPEADLECVGGELWWWWVMVMMMMMMMMMMVVMSRRVV